jgi:geranylgeranyl pyrophosphate synthase
MANKLKSNVDIRINSEYPREDQPIEWWFVQGFYEGCQFGRRHFLACIFRHNVEPVPGRHDNGFSLIVSILDPQTQRNEVLSQIDPYLIANLQSFNRQAWCGNLDPSLADTYIQEVMAYGPPHPIRLEKAPVRLQAAPFSVSWKKYALKQTDAGFRLCFQEPESKRMCRFNLQPVSSRMVVEDKKIGQGDGMAYATYPTLRLIGLAGGETVSGEAWLDHQWGRYGGWFVNRSRQGKLMGWDWFGINLDDGTELLAMIHRDMKSNKSAGAFGAVHFQGQEPLQLDKIDAHPTRYWKSPRTHIDYPVQWRLKIRGIDAEFIIEPLADDQEIVMFGLLRAIWEGAGRIRGTIRGRPVTGRVRIELYGYGFIFDFQKYTGEYIRELDEDLKRFFPKEIKAAKLREFIGKPVWKHDPLAHTETLATPVWDLIARNGKRWRSLFALLLLETFGFSSQPYRSLFSTIPELTHSGALIIDDIEDNSRKRRGEDCIHLRYGLDVSLNAANTLYYLPYLLFADHPHLSDPQRLALYRIMVKHAVRAHFGQGLDIYWSRNMHVAQWEKWLDEAMPEKILQMYAYKTSAVIEGQAETVGVITGVAPRLIKAGVDFSRDFGVAFQIMDDLHNLSRSKKWTKICGEDIMEGKMTLVLFQAVKKLEGEPRKKLLAMICSKERRKTAVVHEAIRLIRSSGAVEACRQQARDMFEDAWRRFSRRLPNSEAKIMLRMLCQNLLNVNFDL